MDALGWEGGGGTGRVRMVGLETGFEVRTWWIAIKIYNSPYAMAESKVAGVKGHWQGSTRS